MRFGRPQFLPWFMFTSIAVPSSSFAGVWLPEYVPTNEDVVPALKMLERMNSLPRDSAECSADPRVDYSVPCYRAICGSKPKRSNDDFRRECLDPGPEDPKADASAKATIERWVDANLESYSGSLRALEDIRTGRHENRFSEGELSVFALMIYFQLDGGYHENAIAAWLGDSPYSYGSPGVPTALSTFKSTFEDQAALRRLLDRRVAEAQTMPFKRYWVRYGPTADPYENYRRRFISLSKVAPALVRRSGAVRGMVRSASLDYLAGNGNLRKPTDSDLRRLQRIEGAVVLAENLDRDPVLRKRLASLVSRPGAGSPSRLRFSGMAKNFNVAVLKGQRAERRAQIIEGCMDAYRTGVRNAISPKCRDGVAARVSGVKRSFIEFLNTETKGGENAKALVARAEDIQFAYPRDVADFRREFVNELEDDGKDLAGRAPSDSERIGDFFGTLSAPYLTEAAQRCMDLPDDFKFGDHYVTAGGKIKVSLAAASSSALEGIVAHEIGHAFEDMVKDATASPTLQAKISAALVCLAQQHSDIASIPNLSKGLDEDFADLVAARAPGSTENFACALIDSTDGLTLGNWMNADSHSSDFYRLLHIEFVRKGRLPEACGLVLQSLDRPGFRDCWNAGRS